MSHPCTMLHPAFYTDLLQNAINSGLFTCYHVGLYFVDYIILHSIPPPHFCYYLYIPEGLTSVTEGEL
jgi:hypothetical protein